MQHRSLVAAVLVALAACAALDMPGSAFQAIDSLVREALESARSPAAQQKASLQRAEQTFGRDASALNRLRLAVLLATLAPPLRDDARAAELLEPIADPSAPGMGRFAAFVAGQVGGRGRSGGGGARGAGARVKREGGMRQLSRA